MDNNLFFWKSHGQSFLSRVKIWLNVLDSTVLIPSDLEIQKAHSDLGHDDKLEDARLALSSVHADTGQVLPIIFRPPALLPLSSPLVYLALLPHSTVKSAMFCHFLMQSYFTGFNYVNRNISIQEQEMPLKHRLMNIGTVSYTAFTGALPQMFVYALPQSSPSVLQFFRNVVPIPLAAFLGSVSVAFVRIEETEKGIKVFDSEGNVVGLSKAAGKKAVKETALTRAALFGGAAAGPTLLLALLQRIRFFQQRPLLLTMLRPFSVVIMLGLMIPLSFSVFSQLGTIKKENLEEELQTSMMDGHLFYHRGL